MRERISQSLKFLFFAVCIGGAIGAFIWAFLWVMGIGQNLLFTTLPEYVHIPGLVLILCLAGGLIVGIYEKVFHASPEDMDAVMARVKKEGKYPCDRLLIRAVGALLPLVFGASLGPEAGLTGIIVGLCFWAGGRFRYMGKHIQELSEISIGAALGVIFGSPLFGFMLPIEDEEGLEQLRKPVRMITYLAAILGGFGAFVLLGSLFGGAGLPRLEGPEIGNRERIMVLALIPAGVIAGILYSMFHKGSSVAFEFLRKRCGIVVCTVLAGGCLGLFGLFVPFSMFSGESQMEVLAETYTVYTPMILVGIGVAKILITNICIQGGWKGGHFFPVIFAGVSIGYGVGMFLSIDPVFAASVVTSALLGYMMRKPVAVVLLLMLCFPMAGLVWMLAAAAVGALVPILGSKKDEPLSDQKDEPLSDA